MPYEFLSDDWFAAVEKIAAEAAASGASAAPPMKMNILVEGGPDGDKEVHVSEKGFGRGSDDEAKIKLGIAYDVAKKMFVDGDQSVAMTAFTSGKIRILSGDMGQLMAMGGGMGGASAEQQAFQAKLKEITA